MTQRDPMKLRRYQAAYHLLPLPLYRLARNAVLDIASIPRRLTSRGGEPLPWMVLHNYGGGDFYASGRKLAARIVERLELKPSAQVLDVGCGSGRIAWPLAGFLDAEGGYLGVDVSTKALAFARRLLAARRPDFVFEHADLYNGDYNPRGRIKASDYVFPCANGSRDAVIATSLFTHLVVADARRFLNETGRVLTPGGRAYITAFLVDDGVRERFAQGRARYALSPAEPPMWVGDPRTPEVATGYDEEAFLEMIDAAGLALARPIERGSWSGAEAAPGFQDAVVLARKR